MTDRFVLSTAEPSQLARLGEIQAAAFAQTELVVAALSDVSRADYAAWAEQRLRHFRTPPGHRTEIVCATKNGSDQIVGFALWNIPLDDAADAPPALVPPPVPFPAKAKAEVWAEFVEGAMRCENEVMGEAKHWTLILLGTDPAFSRQGVGRALVQWGVDRAAAKNLPIFILSSMQGEKLYSNLGFSKGELQKLGSARIPVTPMFKGLVAPASAL